MFAEQCLLSIHLETRRLLKYIHIPERLRTSPSSVTIKNRSSSKQGIAAVYGWWPTNGGSFHLNKSFQ